MKKVYFLQTCDTCRRILKEVLIDGFDRQEIKAHNVTPAQLEKCTAFLEVMKRSLINEQSFIK